VLVDGEIWRAEASAPVAAGTPLRVVGHEQLLLSVTPAEASQPPKISE
jgi:membrane-bound ClpP family serine protease